MNAGQYEGIVGRLDAILAKMPTAPVADSAPTFTVHHLDGSKTVTSKGPTGPVPAISRDLNGDIHFTPTATRPTLGVTRGEHQSGAFQALVAVLRTLDDWIEQAKENHEALDHRNCRKGEECWRRYAPSDIRTMVNDVARDLGLAKFPAPATPEEDKPL